MAKITHVLIKDSISLLARTCKLTLAPDSSEESPVAEFGLPGDKTRTTGMTIRPNGGMISLQAAYGDIPQHDIFVGSIEFMDDLEDPDKNVFNIDLSDMPPGRRHRKKLTRIDHQVSKMNGFSVLSAHKLLTRVCALAGIPFGRCDLPDFRIVGVCETVRQTPIEVANSLIGAFNAFEYVQYKVRCDRNGLQIIKIDYTQGGEVTNLHEFGDITKKERHYEMYFPENWIGDSDVLLTGGDKYGPQLNTFQQLGENDDDSGIQPNKPVVKRIKVFKTFEASSQTSTDGAGPDALDQWAETEVRAEVDLDLTFATGVQYTDWNTAWTAESDPDIRQNFDTILGAFAEGQILNLTVVDTRVVSSISRTYDSINGLLNKRETTYVYGEETFTRRVWQTGKDTQIMLQSQTTITTLYPNSRELPQSMVKVSYSYNMYGNVDKTTTRNYYWTRVWILRNTQVETNDTSATSNAEYQWLAQEAQAKADAGYRAVEAVNDQLKKALAPMVLSIDLGSDRSGPNRTPIGKYQLLNGAVFNMVPTNPALRVPMVRTDQSLFPSPNASRLANLDPNGNSTITEEIARSAFQLQHPYLDYAGLRLLWAMCQREKQLEQANAYWEVVTVTGSMDTTPTVGESLLAGDSSGIVEDVTHNIDGDAALTAVTLRRLILG